MKSLKLLPKTKKFKEGQFVTALSYTCMWDNATSYGGDGLWSDSDNDDENTELLQTRYWKQCMNTDALRQLMNFSIELVTTNSLTRLS